MRLFPPTPGRPATGHGAIEIFVSPSEQDRAIYVVGAGGAERWPRSDPMTLCM
jgi:hypothetical protein